MNNLVDSKLEVMAMSESMLVLINIHQLEKA